MGEVLDIVGKYVTFEEELAHSGKVVYTNVGVSMMPLLRQRRDIIEIRSKAPNTRCKRYDVVLYKCGDKYILHRVLKVCPEDYVIAGDHNTFKEYGITDRHIIGVLTSVVRDGKELDFGSFGYRLYVFLWCGLFPVRAFILRIKHYAKRMIGK